MDMLNGWLAPGFWQILLYTLLLTHISIAAVTIFLHRHQAHRALDLHPVVAHFFRFWLWLTTGMVTREWVAIHRRHHAKCETDEDPHSPQVLGLRKVLLEGTELYRAAAKDTETLSRYGKGTPDDWLERRLYAAYPWLGITLMLLIDLLLLGTAGLAVWAVQMVWMPWWAAGVINGMGHALGYRNSQCPDASTNIVPWGILIGGEELHNNHHAYPASARLSFQPWEFDIGWSYIRLLERLRLARVKRVAPPPARVTERRVLDGEAVRAIVNARFQVLARYGREVVKQVHRQELRELGDDGRRMLKRVRALLLREESLLDADARRRLGEALERSDALRTVYEYQRRLQAIWNSSMAPDRAAQALQEWCRQAEASGIEALEGFAQRLRGWRLEA